MAREPVIDAFSGQRVGVRGYLPQRFGSTGDGRWPALPRRTCRTHAQRPAAVARAARRGRSATSGQGVDETTPDFPTPGRAAPAPRQLAGVLNRCPRSRAGAAENALPAARPRRRKAVPAGVGLVRSVQGGAVDGCREAHRAPAPPCLRLSDRLAGRWRRERRVPRRRRGVFLSLSCPSSTPPKGDTHR